MSTTPDSPATPALYVDVAVMDANIHAMAALTRDRGVQLRPHAKTHKSPAIADRQTAAGAHGLTVATVSEAETFAMAGHQDLFLAYPLWVDRAKGRRLRELTGLASLTIGCDSAEAANALAAQLSGDREAVRMLIEVDSGQRRSGVLPHEAGELAARIAHTGLSVAGVFTFPGHGYTPTDRSAVARQEADALAGAVASVRDAGLEVSVVSGGSTPTAPDLVEGAMTEMRPGVYVFGDAQQWELGTTTPDRIALTCLATVVSHAGGRVVLDSGSKVLGADRAGYATGYGRLLDHPDARIVLLSEHHAVVEWHTGPVPAIGSRVRVVPNHVCAAVNLADELLAVDNGEIVEVWPVAARGANT